MSSDRAGADRSSPKERTPVAKKEKPDNTRDVFTPSQLVAAVLLGGTCVLYYQIVPIALGAMVDQLHFPETRIGLVYGVYGLFISLSCLASVRFVRKLDWRITTATGSVVAALAFVGCLWSREYGAMLGFHALAGVGCGLAYGPVLACLGDTHMPARSYALVFLSQVAQGAVLVEIVPRYFSPGILLAGTFKTMIGCCVACIALSLMMPRAGRRRARGPVTQRIRAGGRLRIFALPIAFSAMFLIFAGDSAIWAYMERIVAAAGHPPAFAGTALMVSLIAGAVGSLAASWVGMRLGFLLPMIVAVALSIASVAMLQLSPLATAIVVAIAINGWAWNFGSAYRMAVVALLDATGRWPAAIPAAQLLGGSFGAATGGFLVSGKGFLGLYIYASCLWLAALGAYSIDFVAHRMWTETETSGNDEKSEP
ncbi:MAG: MFS transporter [Steroidobacterales bacterium]